MTTDTRLLEPTRENVFTLATHLLESESKVPVTPQLRPYFSAPTSPAIAVYFTEWKNTNREAIASLRNTKEQWKQYAELQAEHLLKAQRENVKLQNYLEHLTNYLQVNHSEVWERWQLLDGIKDTD